MLDSIMSAQVELRTLNRIEAKALHTFGDVLKTTFPTLQVGSLKVELPEGDGTMSLVVAHLSKGRITS